MISRDWSYSFTTRGGIKCTAKIGPYVWMYHGGKVDAIIVEDERSCELRPSCSFDMATSTPEQLERFLASYAFEESDCKTCGYHMLAHKSHYRTNDECDTCCKDRLSAEWAVEAKEQEKQDIAEEKKMLSKGYLFKTVMWVHPGGDDYMLVMFTSMPPTKAQISAQLKKEGSRRMDDYSIKNLMTGKIV